LFGVPNGAVNSLEGATERTLEVRDHLGFVTYLINSALPGAVPYYSAFRRRPFTFLGRRREFVSEIRQRLPSSPQILEGFAIRPRYALEARIIEPVDEPLIGLFVTLSTRFEITADLRALAEAGVDLSGLDVVRRRSEQGQRRLVGRVDHLAGEEVMLSESFDELSRIPVGEVAVEGSRETFTICLRTILGSNYDRFEGERQRLEGDLLGGRGVDKMLTDMGGFLSSVSPIALGDGLGCVIEEERLTVTNSEQHRSVRRAQPVTYCYDPARTKRDQYAWRGLATYGPFSRETFAAKSPRILVLVPEVVQGTAETFVRALRDGISGRAYPSGFAATFGLANPSFVLQRVDTATALPHQAYRRAIEDALTSEQRYDIAVVVIEDEHAHLSAPVNPYLHAKALLLMTGVPSQDVRTSTMRQSGLAYILQNLAVAVYAKMNGVPWTVDQYLPIADEIVVGLGVAELATSRYHDRQRYMGVTTVFRGDGNYLLGNISRECTFDEYPQALRESIRDVLSEIKQRNGWKPDDTVRIVFHTTNPMRTRQLDRLVGECVRTVGSEQDVEFAFLTVGDKHPFTVLDPDQSGLNINGQRKGALAPERGTIVQVSPNQRLLAITGPSLVKRPDAPLPRPLHLRLHRSSTFRDLDYLTEQVLKFTSLSWRSTLPAKRPVTIYYSELMAGLLARLRSVPDWSPALLNTRLKYSRWFL
ncbi:MAG: argonaute/piwi family protein, partial [Chloroflexota bacterium]